MCTQSTSCAFSSGSISNLLGPHFFFAYLDLTHKTKNNKEHLFYINNISVTDWCNKLLMFNNILVIKLYLTYCKPHQCILYLKKTCHEHYTQL